MVAIVRARSVKHHPDSFQPVHVQIAIGIITLLKMNVRHVIIPALIVWIQNARNVFPDLTDRRMETILHRVTVTPVILMFCKSIRVESNYYLIIIFRECILCHPLCSSCLTTLINGCDTCNSADFRTKISGRCDCMNGYRIFFMIF